MGRCRGRRRQPSKKLSFTRHQWRIGQAEADLSVGEIDVDLAEQPERVFEAFWTTKSSGLGLGLSLSRSMIEANDGHIRAERVAGGGACFVFDLPVAIGDRHA